MRHDEIQWDYCPIPGNHLHGRYRGFDVHQWEAIICFYPSEGEATEQELEELLGRISTSFHRSRDTQWEIGITTHVTAHYWDDGIETCLFKERHDKQLQNYCLEVNAPTLDERLDLLDEVIDALWEQSGLRSKPIELPVGRWR